MTRRLVVFSDLDGTLLDRERYSFEEAEPALRALRERGIPLVLCSGKTRAEMEPLRARLGLDAPFIVENGGAIVVPEAGPGPARLVPLGVPRAQLIAALVELERETGIPLRPFSQLSPEEVAGLTGLSAEQAARAQQRDYDEPFLITGPGMASGDSRDRALDDRLDAAARRFGLRVIHGGRLHHLTGPSDKGTAVRAVLRLPAYQRVESLGLGDAASDRALLEAVDRPILVPGPGGIDPALATALPAAERAPAPGPRGWNRAVLTILEGGQLPRAEA
jgi:mannosyl-3-phosphoglycerate phosphatase